MTDSTAEPVFTLRQAQVLDRCRICGRPARETLPLILDYGKEFAHEKCLSSPPRSRDAEGEDCLKPFYPMKGRELLIAQAAYRDGYRAGRSQPIDGFYRDGIHKKDCPCAECNGNADRKEQMTADAFDGIFQQWKNGDFGVDFIRPLIRAAITAGRNAANGEYKEGFIAGIKAAEPLTPAQADAEMEAAVGIPISSEQIQEIVDRVIKPPLKFETADIEIDRKHYSTGKRSAKGSEIRDIPRQHINHDRDLWMIVPGDVDKKIEDADIVELRDGKRFFTTPAQINAGTQPPPASDVEERTHRWSCPSYGLNDFSQCDCGTSAFNAGFRRGIAIGRAEVLAPERVERVIEKTLDDWNFQLRTVRDCYSHFVRDFVEHLRRGGE